MSFGITEYADDEKEMPPELPTEYETEVDGDFDPEQEAADLLSDKFGWCVLSCNYEWKE